MTGPWACTGDMHELTHGLTHELTLQNSHAIPIKIDRQLWQMTNEKFVILLITDTQQDTGLAQQGRLQQSVP